MRNLSLSKKIVLLVGVIVFSMIVVFGFFVNFYIDACGGKHRGWIGKDI
ncbi:MAG: hypothetical protein U5J62_02260 [Desulfurivibrio sp.]|nr:hypothetical protein [Desulfurivibrio sp.]